MRKLAALLLRSFLQGLLLLSPIVVTGYIIYVIFDDVDRLVPYVPRGLGFVIIIVTVTIIGYMGSRFFLGKIVFEGFGYLMERTPGVKYIYTSVKDVMSSFVGDKKKFNKPVWVCISQEPEIWRIGFMTQKDMAYMGMAGKAAVYLPHAYAISGWVVITDTKNIKPVTKMSAAQAMKFAVSGGITNIEDDKHEHAKKNQL